MAGAGVSIRVDAIAGKAVLDQLVQSIGIQKVLDAISLRLMAFVDESFATQGRGKWPPLAWGTVAMRTHGGSVPLQDTGKYRQSFVGRTFITPGLGVAEIGSDLTVGDGSDLQLSQIHEAGTHPYTIQIKNAHVLAAKLGGGTGAFQPIGGGPMLRGRSGGRGDYIFFGKEVHHPGVPARPVLPTQAEGESLVVEVVEGQLDKAIRDAGAS